MSLNIRNPIYCSEECHKVNVTVDHPEFGTIPYTFDPSAEDGAYDTEIRAYLESIDPSEIAPYVPYIPSQEELDKAELLEKKQYLAETDWVVVKIQETALLGEATTDLINQYQAVLEERRASRTRINELEAQFENIGE